MSEDQNRGLYAFEFFKTIFRIKRALYNELPEQFSANVGTVEIMALHYLKCSGQIKTSVLSDYLGIPGSTLTGILDRMEKKEYIVRTRDPGDRRVVLVKLNDKLRASASTMEDTVREFLAVKNIDLPSSWWQEMTKELKRLESLLRESEN
jgi:DNA-binding MarR family transcriptional regulator